MKNLQFRRLAFLAVMLGGIGTAAFSQALPPTTDRPITSVPGKASSSAEKQPPSSERTATSARRLPADVTTEHRVDLPARSLRFKMTAGALPISDAEGAVQAEIAYIAFILDAVTSSPRPVTFVFNGGPGASSVYLQLGAMGPWRLPLDNIDPSTPPVFIPNNETWLDFTDLVFIDAVGSGYSRFIATSESVQKRIWSVNGDAESLAIAVRKWVEQSGRQTAPKFVAGESYGGFRAPKVALALQNEQGVGISGLVLMSPVLDFGWRGHYQHSPLLWVSRLPSMAAAAREARYPFDREALREVEHYAMSDFLVDLMRGERDKAAVERISERVAALTGLDLDLVRRMGGRVDVATFQRELNRKQGLVTSAYDATVTGFDPYPTSSDAEFDDPFLNVLSAPLIAAATKLYRDKFGWQVDAQFQLLNREVKSRWDWGHGRISPEVVGDLRKLLAGNRRMRVLVAHGATDLVTPYFENQLIIQQLPAFGSTDRLKLAVYGGGHMFYSRDASRAALRTDALYLIRAASEPSK